MVSKIPVELYVQILNELPGRQPSTLTTVLSFLSASTVTRAAALERPVWEKLYRSRYTHCDETNEQQRRDRCGGDLRLMFMERYKQDSTALSLLDAIRTADLMYREASSTASQIVREMSFDVWDALELETQLPIPKVFRDPASDDMAEEPAPHALPRRFWARCLMGAIARSYVVRRWRRLLDHDEETTFDDVLAGFSAFLDRSPKEAVAQLDALALQCRQRLSAEGLELDKQKAGYNLVALIRAVREFIHDEGFAVATGTEFMNLMNQFPHHFLGAGRSTTIPISMCWIFCGICRRLSIQAEPTNTPGKVLSHITSPDPQSGDMLIDVCTNAPPIIFSSKDLTIRLAEAGLTPADERDTVFPADLGVMLRRAAQNTINFMRSRDALATPPDMWCRVDYSAKLAMYAFNATRGDPGSVQSLLCGIPMGCDLDHWPVLVDALLPPSEAEKIREEVPPYTIHRRQIEGWPPWFVGEVTLLGSKREEGYVIDWWAATVRRGRRFFYHVVVERGTIICSSADDRHPKPAPLTAATARRLRRYPDFFDRYFEDAVIPRADGMGGRFIPSLERQRSHPHDLDYGARWTKRLLEQVQDAADVSTA
ncbi:Transglutaminase-like superfamily-domain-containing protein [Trametes punicea]|nr:Transglutaminase-like superfamily-domain-containing protein [Trametes punicea]